MFRRPHRRPFAAAIALSAAIGSVPVTLAIADEVPQGAANRSASLGDADAVASWVDETVLEGSAAAESTPTTPERRLLHRNSKRPSAKVTDPKPPASEAVLDTSLFEMAWPMLIVLFVISLCVYAFKRWMPRSSRPGGGDAVKILARHYLSSKQSLCLVRTGRRVVLVGIDAGSDQHAVRDDRRRGSGFACRFRGKRIVRLVHKDVRQAHRRRSVR